MAHGNVSNLTDQTCLCAFKLHCIVVVKKKTTYNLWNPISENQKYIDILQTLLSLYVAVQLYQHVNKKVIVIRLMTN